MTRIFKIIKMTRIKEKNNFEIPGKLKIDFFFYK